MLSAGAAAIARAGAIFEAAAIGGSTHGRTVIVFLFIALLRAQPANSGVGAVVGAASLGRSAPGRAVVIVAVITVKIGRGGTAGRLGSILIAAVLIGSAPAAPAKGVTIDDALALLALAGFTGTALGGIVVIFLDHDDALLAGRALVVPRLRRWLES